LRKKIFCFNVEKNKKVNFNNPRKKTKMFVIKPMIRISPRKYVGIIHRIKVVVEEKAETQEQEKVEKKADIKTDKEIALYYENLAK
jgi:hypothetical protein